MAERYQPCLICGATFKSALPEGMEDEAYHPAQPSGASVFLTHGHYGSSFWDPIVPGSEEVVEVWICDAHLIAASRDTPERVAYKQRTRTFEEFDPYPHLRKESPNA